MKTLAKRLGWIALIAFVALLGYETVAVLKARQATPEIFAKILADSNDTIKLRDVPTERIKQLLAVEDPEFYQHHGVDFTTPGAGITTITQGMVKYLYFDNFRPGFMKLEQSLIAWLAVDPLVSKDDQLTAFINTAYLGRVDSIEVRGFPAAARAYFNKSFDQLTDDEYLSIVAMLIGPNHFSVKHHLAENQERVRLIKKVLSGEYKPKGNSDVYYDQGA